MLDARSGQSRLSDQSLRKTYLLNRTNGTQRTNVVITRKKRENRLTMKPKSIFTPGLRSYKDAGESLKAKKRPSATVAEALERTDGPQTTDVCVTVISLPVGMSYPEKMERILENADFLASIDNSDVQIFAMWVPEGSRQKQANR
jgi:hypothetical protein